MCILAVKEAASSDNNATTNPSYKHITTTTCNGNNVISNIRNGNNCRSSSINGKSNLLV